MLLGFDLPHGLNPDGKGTAVSRGYPTVLLRIVILASLVWLWTSTETIADEMTCDLDMGTRGVHASLHDVGHIVTAPLRQWIVQVGGGSSKASDGAANELILGLCGVSALLSEPETKGGRGQDLNKGKISQTFPWESTCVTKEKSKT